MEGGDKHLVALAPRQIMKAVEERHCLTDALRKTLLDLESQLSAIVAIPQNKTHQLSEFEKRLQKAEEKFLAWESKELMIWDSGPVEASKYLKAVREINSLIKNVGGLPEDDQGSCKSTLLSRANNVLQLAMSRLEEELIQILLRYKQTVDPAYMSFRLSGARQIVYDDFSFASIEEESSEESSEMTGSESEDYVADLVHPLAIPHLKSIATAMFSSNHGDEFCEAFINTRREAFDDYLVVLGMQKFSIEDVRKMEWTSLSLEIKKWMLAMKIIVRVYLVSEKRLCDKILGQFGSFSSYCFLETTMPTMGCLLNFGVAIAIGPRSPEKLFSYLDMYVLLANLLHNIDVYFVQEAGFVIRNQFHEILRSLGNLAKTTFLEFGNCIASHTSANPFSSGGIHPLSRYVMNFIKSVTDYSDTLNLLLRDQHITLNLLLNNQLIERGSPETELDDRRCNSSPSFSPTSLHLLSITQALESNLESKSKLYKDEGLQHVFMMNNLQYIVQKIKTSGLGAVFGDEWIRTARGKVQQLVRFYIRASWGPAISLLKDDNRVTYPLSRRSSRDRCKAFIAAFEEVYKTQTGWFISDLRLREEVQIEISQNIIRAYQDFYERVFTKFKINDKLKYSIDDLEKFLVDLFEGSPRVLSPVFTCRT